MPSEMHIASVVVQAQPRQLDEVAAAIQVLPGARIHGRSDAGKLVVTLDGSTADDILDQVRAMQQLRGVVNVALVYQHIEPDPEAHATQDDQDDRADRRDPGDRPGRDGRQGQGQGVRP